MVGVLDLPIDLAILALVTLPIWGLVVVIARTRDVWRHGQCSLRYLFTLMTAEAVFLGVAVASVAILEAVGIQVLPRT